MKKKILITFFFIILFLSIDGISVGNKENKTLKICYILENQSVTDYYNIKIENNSNNKETILIMIDKLDLKEFYNLDKEVQDKILEKITEKKLSNKYKFFLYKQITIKENRKYLYMDIVWFLMFITTLMFKAIFDYSLKEGGVKVGKKREDN